MASSNVIIMLRRSSSATRKLLASRHLASLHHAQDIPTTACSSSSCFSSSQPQQRHEQRSVGGKNIFRRHWKTPKDVDDVFFTFAPTKGRRFLSKHANFDDDALEKRGGQRRFLTRDDNADPHAQRRWKSTKASSSSSSAKEGKSNSKQFYTSSSSKQSQNQNQHSRFTSKPKSLAIPFESTSEVFEVPEKRSTSLPWYTRIMLKVGGYDSSESVQNRASQRLFKAVVERCDEAKFYEILGLEHSFRTEHAMFVLHVWLVLARLRREGDSGKAISQMFYDTFQEEVEKRVHREGVKVRVRSTLKELEQSFYGSALAYDKALSSGNDDFMKSLRRNVFMNEGDEKNAKALERYCRREMACLHITETEAVVSGRVRFSSID